MFIKGQFLPPLAQGISLPILDERLFYQISFLYPYADIIGETEEES
jgi:hypothetical protein